MESQKREVYREGAQNNESARARLRACITRHRFQHFILQLPFYLSAENKELRTHLSLSLKFFKLVILRDIFTRVFLSNYYINNACAA